MKREDFRLYVDMHYPNINDFIKDFNNMGGNLKAGILKYHLEYPYLIDEGWLNAYTIFFQNRYMPELALIKSVIEDKIRNN